MGGSSSKQTNQRTTYTESRNYNLQAVEADNVLAGTGNRVYTTDHDAITEGGKTAREALQRSGENFSEMSETVEKTTKSALEHTGNTVDRAFDFGKDSIKAVKDVSKNSLDFGSKALTNALSRNENVTRWAMDFADNATRSDESIDSQTLIKYGSFAIAAVVLAVVLKG